MGGYRPHTPFASNPDAPEGRPGGGSATVKTRNITVIYSRYGQLKFNLPT